LQGGWQERRRVLGKKKNKKGRKEQKKRNPTGARLFGIRSFSLARACHSIVVVAAIIMVVPGFLAFCCCQLLPVVVVFVAFGRRQIRAIARQDTPVNYLGRTWICFLSVFLELRVAAAVSCCSHLLAFAGYFIS